MLDFTPCRKKWTWRTGNSSSTNLSNCSQEKDLANEKRWPLKAKLTWYILSCSPGISGKKWPRRPYECINRTKRQNASSSGICFSHLDTRCQRKQRKDTNIQQQNSNNERQSLTVPDLWIVQWVCLQDIEEILLSNAVSICEEGMVRECSWWTLSVWGKAEMGNI